MNLERPGFGLTFISPQPGVLVAYSGYWVFTARSGNLAMNEGSYRILRSTFWHHNTIACQTGVYNSHAHLADIQQIISEDLSSINQGRLNAVRTEHEIETYCELIIWFVLQYNWADIHRNFVECGTNRGQAVEQEDSFATP
jgi:hypothetical protein